MDRRVRIEYKATTQDSTYGRPVITWTTLTTTWANVQDALPSRGESQPNEIRLAERPARVRMRYDSRITSDMRLVYVDRSDRLMKIITQPAELGRKEGIEFMVSEYSTSGDAA